ncbi:MAG TPA: LacI family DNA-binding transcriptional regulator [Cellulomonas sp.]
MALTSKDVADRAGVSRSTVSYILNGHGDRFSATTRAAVERAVADLGYRPQAAGRALVRGQSDIVLLVLPHAAGGRINEIIDALTAALAAEGLALLLRSATAAPDTFPAMVAAVRPRAVVNLTELSGHELAVLDSAGTRVVDVARAASRPQGSNWAVGRLQVAHLVAQGHRRVAYARLAEAGADSLLASREGGVREACREAALPDPQVVTVALRADADLDAVAALPAGTAVACFNDETAAAALGAARVLAREVPGDLAFIGVDDSPVAAQTHPRLTTIGYDIAAQALAIARAVVAEDDPAYEELDVQTVRTLRVVEGGTA